MIDGSANDGLLKHLRYVAHNTMGRFIAETDSEVRSAFICFFRQLPTINFFFLGPQAQRWPKAT
jgi:hypothetical protein